MDVENYLQWRKIVEIRVKGRGKKRYLAEGPLESITDEWERDDAQLFSQILNTLEVNTNDVMMHTLTKRCLSV